MAHTCINTIGGILYVVRSEAAEGVVWASQGVKGGRLGQVQWVQLVMCGGKESWAVQAELL